MRVALTRSMNGMLLGMIANVSCSRLLLVPEDEEGGDVTEDGDLREVSVV